MKVTFAYPYTDPDGKAYKPDQSADVPDELATQLIRDGKARTADSKSKKES
jgi:hypothetical protein